MGQTETAAPVSAPAPWSNLPLRLVDAGAFALPLLVFLILKGYATAPFGGDENIYFYVGSRIAQGLTPYRDIFFAHPPGHLLIAAAWMFPGWIGPWWAKLASIVPAALTIAVVMIALWRSGLPKLTAALAGLALAISHNYLAVSTHFTGANWSDLWLTLGVWLLSERRRSLAGALLALAALTSFHLIPAVCGALLADLITARKRAWPSLAAASTVTLAVHALFWIWGGTAYIEQVFGYHLAKTPMPHGGAAAAIRFFHDDWQLTLLAIAGVLAWQRMLHCAWPMPDRASQHRALWTIAALSSGAQFAGVLFVDRVYTYYLAPLLPLFAFLAGLFVHRGIEYITTLARCIRQRRPISRMAAAGVAVVVLLSTGAAGGEALERGLGYFQRQYGDVIIYSWRDSPVLPGWLNRVVETLCFRAERRVGGVYTPWTKYLWHEFASEDPSPLLPRLHERDDVAGTVFGDASTAPYFALATGRGIALEQADTNAQLFRSGALDPEQFVARLATAPPAFVVLSPTRGIARVRPFRDWLQAHYRLAASVTLGEGKRLQLYQRR